MQIFSFYSVAIFLAFTAWALLHYDPIAFWILFGTCAYFLTRTCLRLAIVHSRTKPNRYFPAPNFPIDSHIIMSSPNYELEQVDHAHLIKRKDGDWHIYDTVFEFYRSTKSGRYLAKKAYYTVFEAKIERHVPHIIFDSKTSKDRQFRLLYLQSQRISLEGNFDTYFDTYSPHTYHIDSLSFITPEVMQALIEAKDYDIELVNDRVFLYGPLLDTESIKHLQSQGIKIAAHLKDNLDTYKDDRLANREGDTTVTPFARRLLKSPMKHMPVLILSGAALVGIAYYAVAYSPKILLNEVTILAIVIFVTTATSMAKILRDNQHQEEKYAKLLANSKSR